MTSTPWSAAGMSRSVSPATAWSPTTWQRMRMLYKPEAFEPLTETSWDEAAVRAHVEKIADEHEAAYDPETLWPAADWDAFNARLPLTTLYAGASGIAWALARLGRDARGMASRAVEA